jgi:hypothetical protein
MHFFELSALQVRNFVGWRVKWKNEGLYATSNRPVVFFQPVATSRHVIYAPSNLTGINVWKVGPLHGLLRILMAVRVRLEWLYVGIEDSANYV